MGAVWFAVLMPWHFLVKIGFAVICVLVAVVVIRVTYVKSRDMSGTITIDLENKTFRLNGTEYTSFADLDYLESRMFTTTRLPQASGFSATFLTLGVGKNTMVLNSMDSARGLTLPQLEGLHTLVKESSLTDEQKELFESFLATIKVIKNISEKE